MLEKTKIDVFDLTHLEMFNYYFIVFVWTADMRTRQN